MNPQALPEDAEEFEALEALDDEDFEEEDESEFGPALIPSDNPNDPRPRELAVLTYLIPKLAERQRVDAYLTQAVRYATRNRIQKAVAEGRVKVNGKVVKNSYGLMQGDLIELTIRRPASEDMLAEKMELDILFEDEHLIVVNKPAGIAVHPTYKHWDGTMANGLLYHFRQQLGDPEARIKPGLIHRLDKFTSGLLVVGKSPQAKKSLGKQFAKRQTRKVYYALVWGTPATDSGLIETNLGISRISRMVIDVFPYLGKQGKPARTAWKLLESWGLFSLLEVELFTGRTHQIRSHLRHLGHPILGDFIYGGLGENYSYPAQDSWLPGLLEVIPRQALHAAILGFHHPTSHEWIELRAPVPEDMLAAKAWLGAQLPKYLQTDFAEA